MTHDLKPIIAARLRAARRARKMTQSELAEAVSRTVEAVSNIERGRSLPPIDLLQRAAEVLGVDVVDLIRAPNVSGSLTERASIEAKMRAIIEQLPMSYARVAVQQTSALAELASRRGGKD